MATDASASLSANATIQNEGNYELSANFCIGIDIHAFAQVFQFKEGETTSKSLHNAMTIWLNAQDIVNKTFKAAGIVPLGDKGWFVLIYICS